MHCPVCGTVFTEDLKFCRSCGMNVETISQAVSEHLAATGAAQAPRSREKQFVRWGMIMGLCGAGPLLLMIITIFVLFLAGQLLDFDAEPIIKTYAPWVGLPSAGLLLVGFFLAIYSRLAREIFHRSATQPLSFRPPNTTQELLSDGGHLSTPSVTETTTRTLESAAQRKSEAEE